MNKILLSILLLVSSVASAQVDLIPKSSGGFVAKHKGLSNRNVAEEFYYYNPAFPVTGGSGTGGTAKLLITRVGQQVTINWNVTVGTTPVSSTVIATSALPTWARPSVTTYPGMVVINQITGTYVYTGVSPNGNITFDYYDWDTNSPVVWSTITANYITFTYNI